MSDSIINVTSGCCFLIHFGSQEQLRGVDQYTKFFRGVVAPFVRRIVHQRVLLIHKTIKIKVKHMRLS